MNILITGGGGFIGGNLIDFLLNTNHKVKVISKSLTENLKIKHPNLSIHIGNYDNNDILNQCMVDIDCIIHLAYTTVPENSTLHPDFDIETNIIPTIKLLKQASEMKVKKIIFVSSGGVVYGNKSSFPITEEESLNPISSYGISKMIIELNIQLLADNFGIDYCILRIANAYGKGQHNRKNQGVINIWMNKILSNEKIDLVENSEIIRDYIHINDIVEAFKLVIQNDICGIYNLGTSMGTNLKEIIHAIEEHTNKKANINLIQARTFDVHTNILSYSKFNKATGWQPTINLKEGIKIIANEYKF